MPRWSEQHAKLIERVAANPKNRDLVRLYKGSLKNVAQRKYAKDWEYKHGKAGRRYHSLSVKALVRKIYDNDAITLRFAKHLTQFPVVTFTEPFLYELLNMKPLKPSASAEKVVQMMRNPYTSEDDLRRVSAIVSEIQMGNCTDEICNELRVTLARLGPRAESVFVNLFSEGRFVPFAPEQQQPSTPGAVNLLAHQGTQYELVPQVIKPLLNGGPIPIN